MLDYSPGIYFYLLQSSETLTPPLSTHTRHFRQEHDLLFTTLFLQSKKCTAPGRRHRRKNGTAFSSLRLNRLWPSWTNTTGERLSLMPASLLWVRLTFGLLFDILLNKLFSTDPRKKFGHFEKNWDADLQVDVKELASRSWFKKRCVLRP